MRERELLPEWQILMEQLMRSREDAAPASPGMRDGAPERADPRPMLEGELPEEREGAPAPLEDAPVLESGTEKGSMSPRGEAEDWNEQWKQAQQEYAPGGDMSRAVAGVNTRMLRADRWKDNYQEYLGTPQGEGAAAYDQALGGESGQFLSRLPPDELLSVLRYARTDPDNFARVMRGETGEMENEDVKKFETQAGLINRVLGRYDTEEDRTVYRGVSRQVFSGMLRETGVAQGSPSTESAADLADYYNALLRGQKLRDNGALSAPASSDQTKKYGKGGIIIQLDLPSGTKGAPLEALTGADPAQSDFIVAPGQSFLFTGAAVGAGNNVIVYLTALVGADKGTGFSDSEPSVKDAENKQ